MVATKLWQDLMGASFGILWSSYVGYVDMIYTQKWARVCMAFNICLCPAHRRICTVDSVFLPWTKLQKIWLSSRLEFCFESHYIVKKKLKNFVINCKLMEQWICKSSLIILINAFRTTQNMKFHNSVTFWSEHLSCNIIVNVHFLRDTYRVIFLSGTP